ncbi:MAG: ATP-dependent RecD-like DNA helicase [Clostridiales bacterium]|jgi:exodeoxyribonuclease V alpha subunit|nr:ATP-dependent RecD-like DNA helicase [Clostridiales bacterium]
MNEISLDGTVENIVFQNPENGFTVFSLKPSGGGTTESPATPEEIMCVGSLPGLIEGESVRLIGGYVVHGMYGRQFSVARHEKTAPADEQSIIKFLSSGIIKGVRERLAKKIVERFGKDTMSIIEETPELLSQITGISPKRAAGIGEVFHQQAEIRRVVFYLQDYGISPSLAIKIHKRYGSGVYDIVKTNPYALADDLWGVGFKTADSIAFKACIAIDSPFRIRAGIRHSLTDALNNGHVYLPLSALLSAVSELLGLDPQLIEDQLSQLQFDNAIVREKIAGETAVYLSQAYRAETYAANKILRLAATALERSQGAGAEIAAFEAGTGIVLAENQKEAVTEAMRHGVLIITGGPGTGKTTTINTIISLLKKYDFSIELAAPTGRAAKRMSEATGMEAKTIHRLLEINSLNWSDGQANDNSRGQSFGRNEEYPLEADIIIIDESSMVDMFLMTSLLRAIPLGSRLILVGDVDQLPSVGPGNVLKDLITSGCVPVVRLTEIFRQAQESAIIMNAHRINRGEYPVLTGQKDFFFVKRLNAEDVAQAIQELVQKRLPSYIHSSPLDIQVLSPMRKSPLGVAQLNQALQARLNPPAPHKRERELNSSVLREGDKVMQLKNNYNLSWRVFERERLIEEGQGVFNGDLGVIRDIDDTAETVTVCFDDNRLVSYDYAQLDELELAYAITIHKSQGSEYKAVVIPIHSGPPMLMSRNLLYTGVTRAKELAVIVGVPETMYRMIDNNKETNRYTSLNHRLVTQKEMF